MEPLFQVANVRLPGRTALELHRHPFRQYRTTAHSPFQFQTLETGTAARLNSSQAGIILTPRHFTKRLDSPLRRVGGLRRSVPQACGLRTAGCGSARFHEAGDTRRLGRLQSRTRMDFKSTTSRAPTLRPERSRISLCLARPDEYNLGRNLVLRGMSLDLQTSLHDRRRSLAHLTQRVAAQHRRARSRFDNARCARLGQAEQVWTQLRPIV